LRRINVAADAGPRLHLVARPDTARQGRFIMQIQSKALPQSFSLRRTFQGFTTADQGRGETSHPLLVFSVVVLLTLFAIVEVDLHSAQLQAIGLLSHGAGIDSIFLSP
jgi:hypothetical protein